MLLASSRQTHRLVYLGSEIRMRMSRMRKETTEGGKCEVVFLKKIRKPENDRSVTR